MPRSVCSDPETTFYPQREVCYATMEREAANAKWSRIHEDRQWHNGTWMSWAAKPSAEHPYPRDAGVTIGVTTTDLRPDDQFLILERCGPPTGLLSEPGRAEPEPADAGEGSQEAEQDAV